MNVYYLAVGVFVVLTLAALWAVKKEIDISKGEDELCDDLECFRDD